MNVFLFEYVPELRSIRAKLNINLQDAEFIHLLMDRKDINLALHTACKSMNGIGIRDLKTDYPNYKKVNIDHYQYVNIGDKDKKTLIYTGNFFIIYSVNDCIKALDEIEALVQN